MKFSKITPLILLLMLCLSVKAFAYEEEDSVPFTITAQSEYGNIGKIAIKLNGKNVEIQTEISNQKNSVKRIGFTAYTPFFGQLGFAEDNEDKTFSDLTALFNGKPLKPQVYRRGFFLGEDVTEKLVKAGIGPLPDKDIDSKELMHRGLPLDDWQGYVAYSWVSELSPHSNNISVIRYQALPQFGRDEISSDQFSYQVTQHCGKPDEIRKYLTGINASLNYVLFERYEIPIKFLRSHKVVIEVSHPPSKKENIQPLFSLVCGISERTGNNVNFTGTIDNPDNVISVLVLSKFAGSIEKESQ